MPLRLPLLAIICMYTALITFKPSEPFLVKFFECIKGIPYHAINADIFPIWSYAYLALLPPMAAMAELIGHRRVVLLGAIGRLLTIVILLVPFSTCSVQMMQLSQVTVAVGFAAHPALSAIMYRGLPRESYVRAAGTVACVGVVAESSASLFGQLLLAHHVRPHVSRAPLASVAFEPPGSCGISLHGSRAHRASLAALALPCCASRCSPAEGRASSRFVAGAARFALSSLVRLHRGRRARRLPAAGAPAARTLKGRAALARRPPRQ